MSEIKVKDKLSFEIFEAKKDGIKDHFMALFGRKWYIGKIVEYPGLVTQGRSEEEVKRDLLDEYQHTLENYPKELDSFK